MNQEDIKTTVLNQYHSWLRFKAWTDELGPIVRFRVFGRENIVISSERIANDLLRERGSICSSREHLTMAADYLSGNLRPFLLNYSGVFLLGYLIPQQTGLNVLIYCLPLRRLVAAWSEAHAPPDNDKCSCFPPAHAVIGVDMDAI